MFIKHPNAYSCFRHYFNICAFHSLCVFYLERKPRIIYNIFMGIMILSAIQSQWYISVCHKFLSRMNLRSHNLNHTWIAFDEERSTLLSLSMKDISIRNKIVADEQHWIFTWYSSLKEKGTNTRNRLDWFQEMCNYMEGVLYSIFIIYALFPVIRKSRAEWMEWEENDEMVKI